MFCQKLKLENVDIDRANRTGKKTENRSRTIILKLKKYEDKSEILKRGKMLKEQVFSLMKILVGKPWSIGKSSEMKLKKRMRRFNTYSTVL